MSNDFSRKISSGVGATAVAVGGYVVPDHRVSTAIGLCISNTVNTVINVDVWIANTSGAGIAYLLKGADIVPGQGQVPIGGDQKLVMQPGDKIMVRSDTPGSVDAILSVLEMPSTLVAANGVI